MERKGNDNINTGKIEVGDYGFLLWLDYQLIGAY